MRQVCVRTLSMLFIGLATLSSPAKSQTSTVPGDSLIQILSRKIEHLQVRVKALETQQKQSQLEALRKKAEMFLAAPPKKSPERRIFKGKQRALQALNPEISATGDYLTTFMPESHRAPILPHLRVLGLHIQSALDPYSIMKAAVEFTPEGIELGEAYVTWNAVLPGLSLTAGKFRQQFGVLNRWHEHALDQITFPLPLTEIFGDEGLVQTGISFQWNMPSLLPVTQLLTFQITNPANHRLFHELTGVRPVWLVHLKNYVDLNRSTYMELGLSGLFNRSEYASEVTAPGEPHWKSTLLWGADLTLLWEPLHQAKYRHFLWRTEILCLQREWLPGQNLVVHGMYSYIQQKFSRRFEAGLRFDWTEPFSPDNRGKYVYQFVPYITWWQSPWVRLRIEYRYRRGYGEWRTDNVLCTQVTWAAGPHKHEKY